MTGRKFIPDLESTRGIENECIATMIDSANVDISNWTTISEGEQARRHQEHCFSAIAQVINAEYPTLLEDTAKENSDNVRGETQITEDQLLSQIKDAIQDVHVLLKKDKMKKHKNPDVMTQAVESSDSASTTAIPLETQTPPPLDHIKPGRSNGLHLPKPKRMKTASVQAASGPSTYAPNDPQKQLETPRPGYTPNSVQNQPSIKRVGVLPISGSGRRNVYQKLRTAAEKIQEPTLCLDLLDFAGQIAYRPMHHCFMSRRAIYIIVFNLQHLLNPTKKCEIFADLQYWLNSIHAHVYSPAIHDSPEYKYKYGKYIFLVGTHKIPGNGEHAITDDDLKKFSSELEEYFFGRGCHFKDEIHFYSQTNLIISGVENSMMQSSSGIELIKKEIEMFSKHLRFLAEVYPISWLGFRDKLLKRKLLGSPLLQLAEAKEIAKDCGVEDWHTCTALQLFHDTGLIIYPGKCISHALICLFMHTQIVILPAMTNSIFLEESEKQQISTVILMEPRWLISIMTKVMEVQMSSLTLSNTDIEELKTTGMVKMSSLHTLWQEDHKGNDNQFEIICLLMRAHGLMQAIKPTRSTAGSTTGSTTTESNLIQFMIPCMLSQKALNIPNGYTFYFDFKGFLPLEVFHCLICLVIKKCQEVPDCHKPSFSANTCIWYWIKGYSWYIQLLSQEHRLKVVARYDCHCH